MQTILLKAIQRFDRHRLRRLATAIPALDRSEREHEPRVLAFRAGPRRPSHDRSRVYTERRSGGVHISVAEGAQVEIGADTWLRSDLGPVLLFAFPGARIRIGREGFLNGCHLSSKAALELGERVWIGPGSRVFDADQHDLDADRRQQITPVRIGDHCWVAADVTILRGVEIGAHSVVGTRSLVTRSLPPHSLAFGNPAAVHGTIGDRSRVPV